MKKRKYTLKHRAARQEQTRERIVDAAIALHEQIGPAATTVSALAEKAGVQRLTVYRHFPRESDVLAACSSKWLSLNPPPDPAAILAADPLSRTRAILSALYGYFEDTQKMWTSVYPDVPRVAALAAPIAGFEGYLATVSAEMLSSWRPRRSKQLRTTLDHAVQFSTWKSLAGLGLSTRAMAELVAGWAHAAAGQRGRGR